MSTISLYSKRFIGWLVLMLLIVVGIRLTRGAVELWQLRTRVTDAEAQVRELTRKRNEIQAILDTQESDFFEEQQFRDVLKMGREDELVVIVPEELLGTAGSRLGDEVEVSGVEEMSNWRKWWAIITQQN